MATDPKTLRNVARYWPLGMDSMSLPDQLGPGEYGFGLNVTNRGGILQTRPGTRAIRCLPGTRLQGFTTFTPRSGQTHLVAAVDGLVYVSPVPFVAWRRLSGLRFSPASRFVEMCETLKSTTYDAAGEIQFEDEPYRVLIIQDGRTRAAFWDGQESRHLNPTISGSETTVEGYDETPIGLYMIWSGNRLWIFNRNRGVASDIGNPLKFTERQYLNEAPAFFLPSNCTGLFELPDRSGFVAMYATGGDFFESSIQDREVWLEAANFQRTIVNVGCLAHRSIVQQHGLVYWFSPVGMISLNDALRANASSELVPFDMEMAWDKARIGPDLSGICCGAFENYLVVSVPWCSRYNQHTWAMDLASFEGNQRAWNGVWTGWRPHQWATAVINGRARCFFASTDHDGVCRIWEAFLGDRTDNGCAITCSAQFKADDVQSVNRKRFNFAKIRGQQLWGDVSVMVAVAGNRGWFERILTRELHATRDAMNDTTVYGSGAARLGSTRPQVRDLTTEVWNTPGACNPCGVESSVLNSLDTHFTLFVGWSGQFGIAGYEIFAADEQEGQQFRCDEPEEGPKIAAEGGCSTLESDIPADAFPDFEATATHEIQDIENVAELISVTSTATSQISQADATRKANCWANRRAVAIMRDPDIRNVSGDVTVVTAGMRLVVYYHATGVLIGALDTIDFGDVNIGDSTDLVLRLVNEGLATGEIGTITLPPELTLVSASPTDSLESGEQTTIAVRFTPTPESADTLTTGTLSIASGDPSSPRVMPWVGRGLSGDNLWYLFSQDLEVSAEEDSADDPDGWEFFDEEP